MRLIIGVLVLAGVIGTAYALCNTCSAITGLACVANNQFEVCVDGVPTAPAVQCPTGTVCSADAQVCSSASTTAPSCNRCGTCDSTNTFACTGYQTFALCYGTTVPDTTSFKCSGTLVCNMESSQICVDPATGVGGTCPSVTTNPNPATDPRGYCASVGSFGRYEITTDPFCKEYILCALVNATWRGIIYECPGSTLYNATSKLCGVEVPARCA